MSMRADSFMAASRFVHALRKQLLAASLDGRFAVGRVTVQPGSVNTVPGRTRFSIDFRHPDSALPDRVEELIRAAAARYCQSMTGARSTPGLTPELVGVDLRLHN
jgi:N-carbamoyl-L-amino-acid hydrolase